MALLGASPGQIAFSQGGQILQTLQMGEGGIAGSLNAIKGSAAAAGTALVGTLGTVGLIATGFGVAAVAAGAFYLLTREKTKDLNDSLKEQRQAILDVASAYDLAKISADNYNKSRGIYAGAAARQGQRDLGTAARSEDIDVLNDLARFVVPGYHQAGFYQARSQFSAFNGPISAFSKDFDYDELAKGVRDITAQNPALQETGDKILNLAKVGHEAAAAFREGADNLARINARAPSLTDAQLGQAYRDQNDATLFWLRQQRDAAMGGIGALSPSQRSEAAKAAERARPSAEGESADVKDFRVETAGALAYAQAIHAITEANEQRRRSMEQTLDSARLDVALVGQSAAAVQTARMENQQLAQVREEAARNGIKDEAEFQRVYGQTIALIKQQSAEYGKQIALEQARTAIHGLDQNLELLQAEVGLVGKSRLEHDRAIASIKVEQQIREMGIPLYGKEAELLRQKTAQQAAYNEVLAKAKVQEDLLFDLRQMGRSQADQSVASQLRSAGLPDDLDSDIAKVIKMRDEVARMKDTWEEVFQTARDGIDGVVDALFSGGSIEDALKKAGQQLARTMFDLAVTNPLKNWLTGSNLNTIADLGIFGNGATSGRGGGFGGVLGNLLGAQKAVASMQVQAASVFINGAPLGVPGIPGLPGLSNPLANDNFAPNTTLTDVLTGGDVNSSQGYISQRINSAFGTLFSQDQIQSRISSAFGDAAGLGGIFTPAGGFANVLGGSGASMARGGGVAGQIWNFFAGKGLAPHQIAGILGNVSAESAFNPLAVGDRGNALGLFQWNDRAPSMLSAIGGRGNLGDVGSQLNFAWKELQTSESGVLKRLLGTTDVRGATAAFAGFERPEGFSWANPEGAHNFLGRLSGAQDALSKFGSTASNATSAVGQLGGASSSALSSLVSSTGNAAGGLNALGSGAGKLGSMLGQFPAAPGGGGGGGFGGLFNMFGSLFGGGGLNPAFSGTAAYSFLSANPGGFIGLYADGTESAPPGWAWVGEKGPELRKLRAGDVIRSNPRSVEMMKQASAGSNDNFEGTLRKLAPLFRSNNKIINVFDPSVVGDYLRTEEGQQVLINEMRRNGK
ncbi:hypothetical protein EN877_30745 [Mesorhizobium sp. M1D.F.Ca.ET.234.01.1.1]|nr:hypothetical protein EN877_30745 [Mesorhizobium sp. M1D.F.Ca.ET.234.01.1.1]